MEFPQGSKFKMDLSLICQTDPKALPKELVDLEWPLKSVTGIVRSCDCRCIE
jgi:hypothetical protein